MRFKRSNSLIIVRAELFGLGRKVVARLAVDTGATSTVIAPALLRDAGYVPENGVPALISTAGGLVDVFRIAIRRITCLRKSRSSFSVIAHNASRDSRFDGLLGLDFLKLFELTINFPNGIIKLAPP